MVTMDTFVDIDSIPSLKGERVRIEDGGQTFIGTVIEAGGFGDLYSLSLVTDQGITHSFEFLGDEDDPKIIFPLT